MHKFSAVVLVSVAFAAVCADAASARVFSRQDDFIYHQVARDSLDDKRSGAYERDLAVHDSNLERRVTVGEVVGAGAVAWGAHEIVKSHEKEKKKEEASSSSSLAEATPTPTPTPARRAALLESRVTVGEVVGAGAVAWGAHEIVKSHEKEKKKEEASSSSLAEATPTPTPSPARRAVLLESRITVGEVVGAGAVAWGAHEVVKSHEKEKKKEEASSSSSLAEATPTPTPARRAVSLESRITVGEVVGAGAVAWGAHEIVKSHDKEKKKEEASSSSSLAEATPTPTPARRTISLNTD